LNLENYDHAIVALMLVFQHANRSTTFVGKDQLERASVLLKKAYSRYPIRKRYQLVDSLLSMLNKHLNIDEVQP
jgi:ADP-heptose:LPS heptosyltransferase